MTDTELNDLLTALEAGEFDAQLDQINDSVKFRREVLQRRTMRGIKPGDTVKFTGSIRPLYLDGKTATVTKVNEKSVLVECPPDPAYKRFSGSKNVRCPMSIVEKVAT